MEENCFVIKMNCVWSYLFTYIHLIHYWCVAMKMSMNLMMDYYEWPVWKNV